MPSKFSEHPSPRCPEVPVGQGQVGNDLEAVGGLGGRVCVRVCVC